MGERDYQTTKVILITDIHFTLIFSNWLSHTDPNSQQIESPTMLHFDSDCSYTPQVMEKGLALIFHGCVQFALCFSISAKDNTSVCLTSILNQGPSSIHILIPCHIVKASQLDICLHSTFPGDTCQQMQAEQTLK